jgi:hypothetical protein
VGRPTKYTAATIKKITDALKAGNTRTAAVGAAGIDYTTFCDWLRDYPQFSQAVIRAEHEAEAGYVEVLKKAAANGDWRAAESWLKRRRREDWGDNVAIDVDAEVARTLSQLAALNEAPISGEATD